MTQKRYTEIPKRQKCINIEETNIGGTLEAFANAMASNRNSGSIAFDASGSEVTYQGIALSASKTINFGSSMVNPTSEETSQGWQVV